MIVFAQGQDVNIVLLLAAVALALLVKQRDFAGGLVLSLCLIKFHLFVLAPLVLLRYRRWRAAGGAALGCGILLLISFVAAGPNWPAEYWKVLRDPQLRS